MERRYNEQAFTPEDVEAGLMNDLINHLLDYNKKSERAYYDIHITTDGYCSIVQWVSVPYNEEHYNGEFVFKDEDEVIMKEMIMPDNSYEYCFPDEAEERLDEWYKNNSDYYKDENGN